MWEKISGGGGNELVSNSCQNAEWKNRRGTVKQFWTRSALDEFSRIMLPMDGFLCWKTHTHTHTSTLQNNVNNERTLFYLSRVDGWSNRAKTTSTMLLFVLKDFFSLKFEGRVPLPEWEKTTAEFEQIMTISAVVAEFSAEYKVSYITLFSSFPLFLSLLI